MGKRSAESGRRALIAYLLSDAGAWARADVQALPQAQLSPHAHCLGAHWQGLHLQALQLQAFDMVSLHQVVDGRKLSAAGSGGKVRLVAFYAMPSATARTRKVALIGYERCQSLDLVGPFEVFRMASFYSGVKAYDVMLASPEGGDIVTNSGLRLAGAIALKSLPRDLDTILVAGGDEHGVRSAAESKIVDWVRNRAKTTPRVGSVCSGAFVLAAAGLLDGRRATTHWEACDELRRQRPAVRLEPDAIYVADPPFYTSAGVTAGFDLCLSFVEADCGADVALRVARNLVLFMRRPGGQTQYSAALNVQMAATPTIRKLVSQISSDPTGDLSLPALADRAGMSERTFSRVFHKETGVTPAAFVELARVDRAKALLETSSWPLARVAERAGLNSLDALHRAFQKRVGVTPGEYRDRFGQRGRT